MGKTKRTRHPQMEPPEIINANAYYRPPMVGAILGLCRSQVYKMIKAKTLPPWDRFLSLRTSGYYGRTILAIASGAESYST
jgi:predicted DNA-binding transcriptional regulator AlpA